MITKRNFITIMLMFAVLFFMFMFLQVMKEMGNEYDVNPYAKASVLVSGDAITVKNAPEKDQVYFLGSEKSKYLSTARQWCSYTKREFHRIQTLRECSEDVLLQNEKDREEREKSNVEGLSGNIILVDAGMPDYQTDLKLMVQMVKEGNVIIFCNLPDIEILKENEKLRELLGIEVIQADSVTTEGIKLFGGFLLGGESIYKEENGAAADAEGEESLQDLELVMPWFLLNKSCKTYMVGLLEDKSVKNEQLPAVLWRCSVESGIVFAVNGNYMENCTGIGLLDAMMTDSKSYEIYPVVNAQNMAVSNFPGFANENNEKMQELYSRNQTSLFRDIIWPGLCSMAMKSDSKLTCYMTTEHNYLDRDEASPVTLEFFLKQMREQSAEGALSLDFSTAANLKQKLTKDEEFFEKSGSKYSYRAAYMTKEQLPYFNQAKKTGYASMIQTVTCNLDYNSPVLSFLKKDVTVQMITSVGIRHTFSDDLRTKALETALGYSNIVMDMSRISWPKEEKDRWEIIAEKFSSNTATYWKPFQAFEHTTASESDRRARSLLALDYRHRRVGSTVFVEVEAEDEPWFLFRTHGEKITSIDGGDFTKVEENAFLIQAKSKNVKINLRESDELYYTLN